MPTIDQTIEIRLDGGTNPTIERFHQRAQEQLDALGVPDWHYRLELLGATEFGLRSSPIHYGAIVTATPPPELFVMLSPSRADIERAAEWEHMDTLPGPGDGDHRTGPARWLAQLHIHHGTRINWFAFGLITGAVLRALVAA